LGVSGCAAPLLLVQRTISIDLLGRRVKRAALSKLYLLRPCERSFLPALAAIARESTRDTRNRRQTRCARERRSADLQRVALLDVRDEDRGTIG